MPCKCPSQFFAASRPLLPGSTVTSHYFETFPNRSPQHHLRLQLLLVQSQLHFYASSVQLQWWLAYLLLNITMWAGVPSEPLCLHTQSLATAHFPNNIMQMYLHNQTWKIIKYNYPILSKLAIPLQKIENTQNQI
eukprot:TRINITY_DN15456_c0_g1_i10.p3 TRINITY_DN15456_c0_g1~~TRINITY_DN15456_c0_g1_i10.p3  ORF type:complete len:135 (+),score=4.58 TRINITY_DN15456_c0_g1_i10:583-987(+)